MVTNHLLTGMEPENEPLEKEIPDTETCLQLGLRKSFISRNLKKTRAFIAKYLKIPSKQPCPISKIPKKLIPKNISRILRKLDPPSVFWGKKTHFSLVFRVSRALCPPHPGRKKKSLRKIKKHGNLRSPGKKF